VIRMSRTFASLLFFAIALPVVSRAQAVPQLRQAFVVEYYYKAKWGMPTNF